MDDDAKSLFKKAFEWTKNKNAFLQYVVGSGKLGFFKNHMICSNPIFFIWFKPDEKKSDQKWFFSTLIFWREKLFCGLFSRVKKATIQLFESKSQYRTYFFQMRWKSNQDILPTFP